MCMYTYSICMLDDMYCMYILHVYTGYNCINLQTSSLTNPESPVTSPTLDTKPPPESLSLS